MRVTDLTKVKDFFGLIVQMLKVFCLKEGKINEDIRYS